MQISASTALIKIESGVYPLYLSQVRQENPNVSFPSKPTVEQLEEFGFAVVEQTERPEGDVVTEGTPEFVDGVYKQTWVVREYNTEERIEQLKNMKAKLAEDISRLRVNELAHGFDYTAEDGDVIGVQLRDQDKPNLIVLRDEAKTYVDNGADEVMEFRCRDNLTHLLEPAEMYTMCTAALQYYKAVLKASWDLKDQILAAEVADQLPALPAKLV